MQVFSIFSSEKELINKLIERFLNDKRIRQVGKDDDTIYFEEVSTNYTAFYVHFKTDFEEELEYNIEPEEERFIRLFFKDSAFFMLDISYKDSVLLYQLLPDFVKSLESHYKDKALPLLFQDTMLGFVEIKKGSILKIE